MNQVAGVNDPVSDLRFSEAGRNFDSPPEWVKYFLDLGRRWPIDDTQRIAIISTPCDSAAAGLIALGAFVRRCCEPEANDLAAHLQRIYAMRPGDTGVLKHVSEKGDFAVHRYDADGTLWLEHTKRGHRVRFLNYRAGDWLFEGEPPLQVRGGEALPWMSLYRSLANGASIDESNLRHSDSSIVLAGRSSGRSVTEDIYSALRFQCGGESADLCELLTLASWQASKTVSRIRYMNPRAAQGREFDRPGGKPRTVVADGGDALLRVLRLESLENVSVIAHVPRTDDQSRLEEVSVALSGLRQWFDLDPELMHLLAAPPRGVGFAVLRPRSKA